MICHICNKKLILPKGSALGPVVSLECPNYHACVQYQADKIISYSIVWDENESGSVRYKLIGNLDSTSLYKSESKLYYRPFYKCILSINSYFPLIIKDDKIQFDIIQRLLKLKAFS